MNKFERSFQKCLNITFGVEADSILMEMDKIEQDIVKDIEKAKRSKNPLDARMTFAGRFLCLIKVLQSKGYDYDFIERLCLQITHSYVTPKNKLGFMIKKVPVHLMRLKIIGPILRVMSRQVSQLGYDGGFRAAVITNRKETYGLGYGIDIQECGICKLFYKHNAGEFVSILCSVDRLTSTFAGLELIRKGTIAEGSDHCDFRFRRIKL